MSTLSTVLAPDLYTLPSTKENNRGSLLELFYLLGSDVNTLFTYLSSTILWSSGNHKPELSLLAQCLAQNWHLKGLSEWLNGTISNRNICVWSLCWEGWDGTVQCNRMMLVHRESWKPSPLPGQGALFKSSEHHVHKTGAGTKSAWLFMS